MDIDRNKKKLKVCDDIGCRQRNARVNCALVQQWICRIALGSFRLPSGHCYVHLWPCFGWWFSQLC